MFAWIQDKIEDMANTVAGNGTYTTWFEGIAERYSFRKLSLDWNKNAYPRYFVIYPQEHDANTNKHKKIVHPYNALYGLTQQKIELAKYGSYFMQNEVNKKAQFLIFSGKPGMGKTELAKRTADLFGVPLVVAEPGNILGNNAGETCKNIQILAAECKRMKSCVVLFDEIDYFIGDDSHPAIRSQFRQLIDGPRNIFGSCNILFIGTTNQINTIEKDILTRAEVLPEFIKPDSNQIIEWFSKAENIPRYMTQQDRNDISNFANKRKFGNLSSRDYERCFHVSSTWVTYQLHDKIHEIATKKNSKKNTSDTFDSVLSEQWKNRFNWCLEDKRSLYRRHG